MDVGEEEVELNLGLGFSCRDLRILELYWGLGFRTLGYIGVILGFTLRLKIAQKPSIVWSLAQKPYILSPESLKIGV